MWTLVKKFTFEAAHKLSNHQGKCSRLHGHSWVGFVYVSSNELKQSGSETGMVIDYGEIKGIINPLVDDYLDHYYLNESTGLENPTSEEIARWIYDKIKTKLPGLVAVRVDETCTSQCFYSELSDLSSRISNGVVMG
jgi:6-pyruvoyltetrahydropterin/6-carboxytetrahydropterin synthase